MKNEVVLLHVEPAHVLRQAGRCRLHSGKLIGRLRAIAQRQLRLHVQISCLFRDLDQVRDGNFPKDIPSALGVAHIALDQPRIGAADFGQRFTRGEVNDLIEIKALVGFAPAKDGDVQHGRILLRY